MKKVIATLFVSATLIVGAPMAASATEGDTTEVFWAMPDGGNEQNVTYPQTYLADGIVPCGVTAQVDTYPTDAVAALTADGQLDAGDDSSVYISHRFVTGPDCVVVPEQPVNEPYGTSSESPADCVTGVVSIQTVSGFYGYTLVDNVWVRNAEPTIESDVTSSRPVTVDECPVTVVTPPAVTEPPAAVQRALVVAEPAVLASTGPKEELSIGLALLAGIAVFGGILLKARSLRRNRAQG